jgi:hypothetical protein
LKTSQGHTSSEVIDSEKSTLRSVVAFQWIGSETQAAAGKIGYNDNNDVMEQSWPLRNSYPWGSHSGRKLQPLWFRTKIAQPYRITNITGVSISILPRGNVSFLFIIKI